MPPSATRPSTRGGTIRTTSTPTGHRPADAGATRASLRKIGVRVGSRLPWPRLRGERHRLTRRKLAGLVQFPYSDPRALQIDQNGHRQPGAIGGAAHGLDPMRALLWCPVRSVDADHVGARFQQPGIASSVPVAGPMVATILVRRITSALPWARPHQRGGTAGAVPRQRISAAVESSTRPNGG